jgi:hypothetical protein
MVTGFNCNLSRRKIKIAFSGENNAVSKQTIHLLHPTDSAETAVDHGHVSIQYLSSTMCP